MEEHAKDAPRCPAPSSIVLLPHSLSLQSLPADFLTTMEEYVKDAPRVLDASASDPGPAEAKGGPGGAPKPLAEVRSSSIIKQSGVTSTAIAGGLGRGQGARSVARRGAWGDVCGEQQHRQAERRHVHGHCG